MKNYEDAITDLRSAISKLAAYGKEDTVAKESIANLSVVILDLRGASATVDSCKTVESADEVLEEDDFWSTDVSTVDEVMSEINKAVEVGTTYGDVVDYLDELIELEKITSDVYKECSERSKNLF